MARINKRIMVHKKQKNAKLMMNELKAECVGYRDFTIRTSPGLLLFSSN